MLRYNFYVTALPNVLIHHKYNYIISLYPVDTKTYICQNAGALNIDFAKKL